MASRNRPGADGDRAWWSYDDGALPEVLGLVFVVAEQPLEDVVALADVGQRPRRVVRVGADQQVDAGAPYLLPLSELVELGTRRGQHLAGPVADLGEEDAGGLAVGEEDAGGRTGHDTDPPFMRGSHKLWEGRETRP